MARNAHVRGGQTRRREPRRTESKPLSTVDVPRLVAAKALLDIAEKDGFANLVLPKMLREEQTENPRFDRQDAAFVSEMVYGTTRQQGTLDWVIDQNSSKSLDQLDPATHACLRLGAYQLMYMRVPDHAAVGETVSVARELAGEGPSKFVNAVLRSIVREGKESVEEEIAQIPDRNERLSIQYSHPTWVVDAFARSLDARRMGQGDLELALEANNVAAEVTLAARPTLATAEALAEEAQDVLSTTTSYGALSPYAVTLGAGDPGVLPSIRSGAAGVQDEGSQFAAVLLAHAPLEGPAKEAQESGVA